MRCFLAGQSCSPDRGQRIYAHITAHNPPNLEKHSFHMENTHAEGVPLSFVCVDGLRVIALFPHTQMHSFNMRVKCTQTAHKTHAACSFVHWVCVVLLRLYACSLHIVCILESIQIAHKGHAKCMRQLCVCIVFAFLFLALGLCALPAFQLTSVCFLCAFCRTGASHASYMSFACLWYTCSTLIELSFWA